MEYAAALFWPERAPKGASESADLKSELSTSLVG